MGIKEKNCPHHTFLEGLSLGVCGVEVEERRRGGGGKGEGWDFRLSCCLVCMHLYTTDPSARDREIGSEEELRAKLNLKSHKVLRVYCIISLPEDREVCARSRTARITANTGEEREREQGREGGGREGGREGGKEGGGRGMEGGAWEQLSHVHVVLYPSS